MTAIWTEAHRGVHDAVAIGADLGRRLAVAFALGAFGLNRIDRTVARDVAGEVEH